MNCFVHTDIPATATCQMCGCGLCSRCVTRFTVMRCQSCLVKGNAEATRQAYRAIIATIVVVVLGGFLCAASLLNTDLPNNQAATVISPTQSQVQPNRTPGKPKKSFRKVPVTKPSAPAATTTTPVPQPPSILEVIVVGIFLGFFIACTYWGFDYLSLRKTRLILAGNLMFWVLYFFFRLMLGMFVGLYAGPRKIFLSIRDIRISKQTLAQLQRGEI